MGGGEGGVVGEPMREGLYWRTACRLLLTFGAKLQEALKPKPKGLYPFHAKSADCCRVLSSRISPCQSAPGFESDLRHILNPKFETLHLRSIAAVQQSLGRRIVGLIPKTTRLGSFGLRF